ncbi:hypothetical protein SLEP1_g24530 [Rubroshorea leprosula]|uniref:Transmembrane protein n=1 Tax=Rubroshorea leprosula TaxID=152421 RepID=A0AAV5JG88_9ROSI|nr:hypothetical protein SLEP1_g24530 [Rubroshorea leprosula]
MKMRRLWRLEGRSSVFVIICKRIMQDLVPIMMVVCHYLFTVVIFFFFFGLCFHILYVNSINLGVNVASPNTLAIVHDDGDEIQSDVEYSYISTDEDDGSDADHASRKRSTHVVYEEVEDALPDISLGMIFVSKA